MENSPSLSSSPKAQQDHPGTEEILIQRSGEQDYLSPQHQNLQSHQHQPMQEALQHQHPSQYQRAPLMFHTNSAPVAFQLPPSTPQSTSLGQYQHHNPLHQNPQYHKSIDQPASIPIIQASQPITYYPHPTQQAHTAHYLPSRTQIRPQTAGTPSMNQSEQHFGSPDQPPRYNSIATPSIQASYTPPLIHQPLPENSTQFTPYHPGAYSQYRSQAIQSLQSLPQSSTPSNPLLHAFPIIPETYQVAHQSGRITTDNPSLHFGDLQHIPSSHQSPHSQRTQIHLHQLYNSTPHPPHPPLTRPTLHSQGQASTTSALAGNLPRSTTAAINERKRFHSDPTHSRSSIAGAVYNSGAVYKRLKIADSISNTTTPLVSMRPQGRPFSSNINARFLLHKDLFSLLQHIDKRESKEMLIYDFRDLKSSAPGRADEGDIKAATKNLSQLDIDAGLFEGESGVESLDKFLNCKNLGTTGFDSDIEVKEPIQKLIVYKPEVNNFLAAEASSGENSQTPKETPKETPSRLAVSGRSSLRFLLNRTERDSSEEHQGDNVTSVEPAEDVVESEEPSNASWKSDIPINLHMLIKKEFNIDKYRFIKIIRDNNGRVLKLETITPPEMYSTVNDASSIDTHNQDKDEAIKGIDQEEDKHTKAVHTPSSKMEKKPVDAGYNFTSEWIKKTVCYPRYKSKMKIHMIESSENFILYNDLRMMLWDINEEFKQAHSEGQVSEQGEANIAKGEPYSQSGSSGTTLDEQTKVRLFQSKKVYIKLSS
ncbi:hypothetical protein CANARDRAFT_20552 [[Candida] arabinofermentans NRRL YB-2248]|uniref:Uncharacterized protein n=1 Tax=[Candida] arabinofermentans NRRL YB-2248 TaxID=983967 RepID=A0A1E4T7T3_9ASCO|nr:hypothetical protein CANARDRAFT_20552 [[Candida] arabinofermentans NRRL YB-2248]